jgi:hypothetical protein
MDTPGRTQGVLIRQKLKGIDRGGVNGGGVLMQKICERTFTDGQVLSC